MKKPIVLTIMDGFGFNPEKEGNAIVAASTPRLDGIFKENPTPCTNAAADHYGHGGGEAKGAGAADYQHTDGAGEGKAECAPCNEPCDESNNGNADNGGHEYA